MDPDPTPLSRWRVTFR
ncbi:MULTISPECIES: mgtA regulatory leader peptide MgtL [Kluyvera]|uniref:mgtA leader peptide n=2 Tax=Kluyvera TaxID=579 RepID=A0A6G9RVF1_9ENTR|nr:mgtA regulatory leader peptide MgtL [Kluyvera intermedia]QIR29781.1 mgtA regulatory leader peptide MgtL [Kluyvera genomosp. 3]UAK22576.1 mgtA regulatory leader peptide MgtL [Kluyvera sp. CRP]HCR3983219.1 mgtA regulatory leader peptide MgtL [Kluyvera ascorbata]HDG1689479.1 mgtA regulatory leader peptide MgtL [Kluyvera georgiana]